MNIAAKHLGKMLKPVKTQFSELFNFPLSCLISYYQRYDDFVTKGIVKTSELLQGSCATIHLIQLTRLSSAIPY